MRFPLKRLGERLSYGRAHEALSEVKGFIGRMQLLVKERIVVEVDGALKYQSRQDVPDGKTDEDAIRLEGRDFVRIMGEDMLHPGRAEQKLLTTTYSVEVFVNFTRSCIRPINPLTSLSAS